jgi:hypothetical protein
MPLSFFLSELKKIMFSTCNSIVLELRDIEWLHLIHKPRYFKSKNKNNANKLQS